MGYANPDEFSSDIHFSNRGSQLENIFGNDGAKIKELLRVNGVPGDTFDPFSNIYRYGFLAPEDALGNGKEFVFFTKPDLHIMDASNGAFSLNPELQNVPFFQELATRWPEVIGELQSSYSYKSSADVPFSYYLTNRLQSNIEIPSLTAATIETPVNMFGTNYEYRGSSEASNDNYDFNLEFSDSRNLFTYMYFRAYDEYEMLKRQGRVSPKQVYIEDKILHDEISIFKFITDETHERIVFYAELIGVLWKSCPRDSFNDADFSNGLRYSIDCKASFIDDCEPLIIGDFNSLVANYTNGRALTKAPIYNPNYDQVDLSAVKVPYIEVENSNKFTGRKEYYLRWYNVKR